MEHILEYLQELEDNNCTEWYHANKEKRILATAEFEALVQTLIFKIGESDESILHNAAKDLTFKMVRDTRFSADKSPYNPCMRAHIAAKGKLPVPVGYYIMIKPKDRSFLGGGLFADVFKDATAMLRDYLQAHGAEFEQIVTDATFTRYFQVKGAALKNVPRGYDENSPYAKWLKFKSLYIEYFLTDEQLRSDSFIGLATEVFKAMQPFNAFVNRALRDFRMPKKP